MKPKKPRPPRKRAPAAEPGAEGPGESRGRRGRATARPPEATKAGGEGRVTQKGPAPSKSEAGPASGAVEALAPETTGVARFPIVGIGASAGGLAGFETLFAHMPPDSDTGIAFVLVQHLDPDHKSILSELVRRYTRMRVFEAAEGMEVEPNCVYIIQPNKNLALLQGKLRLTEQSAVRGLRLPIDFFFRSLAQDRGEQSIGIVLSGNGTDGTLGLRAIKAAGGMAMAQEPASAEFDGMPRSAIGSGLADFVLTPEQMPAQLIAYVKRSAPLRSGAAAPPVTEVTDGVLRIMAFLRAHTGHDFSNYKQNTIRRRVERRMVVNQVETLEEYLRLLGQNPGEMETLFRELLIGVTGFFRDPAAFEVLHDLALPRLLGERPAGLPVRVWVPGCSTGEEAYSLAILLQEAFEKLGREFAVQVFATDIDRDSIEKARAGLYPGNIAAEVSPERLARFFGREDKGCWRVKKSLRDQVVFAEQDVIKDPPFSRIDLISCRNVLIYMQPVLQKRLLPLFHYALAPGGFLFLGNSESVGEFTDLFNGVDRKWKVYQRKEAVVARVGVPTMPRSVGRKELLQAAKAAEGRPRKPSLRELTERLLLRNYAPACVAVNDQGEILYVHGRSGRYLELPAGEATLNIVRAAREGLRIELARALMIDS